MKRLDYIAHYWPIIMKKTWDRKCYYNLLYDRIFPSIETLVANENQCCHPSFTADNVWFHLDRPSMLYQSQMTNEISKTFLNRWIGRRGSTERPPGSPDLNPYDYFFWNYFKIKVYTIRTKNLDDFKNRIHNEI